MQNLIGDRTTVYTLADATYTSTITLENHGGSINLNFIHRLSHC